MLSVEEGVQVVVWPGVEAHFTIGFRKRLIVFFTGREVFKTTESVVSADQQVSSKRVVNSFIITKSTKVCDLHLRPEEVKVSIGDGRKKTCFWCRLI